MEQIGYCERICDSASQYAERLLLNKTNLPRQRSEIAQELVREYKDHAFVIDIAEAREHLGSDWVKSGTPELEFAEWVYRLFDLVNIFLGFIRKKRLMVIGRLDKDPLVFERQRRQ